MGVVGAGLRAGMRENPHVNGPSRRYNANTGNRPVQPSIDMTDQSTGVKTPQIKCKECGLEFPQRRAGQEFCCAKHRSKWHAEERTFILFDFARAFAILAGEAIALGINLKRLEHIQAPLMGFQHYANLKDGWSLMERPANHPPHH